MAEQLTLFEIAGPTAQVLRRQDTAYCLRCARAMGNHRLLWCDACAAAFLEAERG